jgi:hypothetical protein
MKDLKNIEDLFKETFDNFESTPPASVKAAVDGAIKKKKRGLWWLPVLALLLATLPLAYYFISNSDIAKEKRTANSIKISNETASNPENTGTTVSSQKVGLNIESPGTNGNETDKDRGSADKGISRTNKEDKLLNVPYKGISETKTKKNKPAASTTKKQTKNGLLYPEKKQNTFGQVGQSNNLSGAESSSENEHNTSDVKNLNGKTEKKSASTDETPDETREKDSSILAASNVTDSLTASSVPEPPSKTTSGNSSKNWTASLYFGEQFEYTQSSNKAYAALKTEPAFKISAEVNRTLFSGYGVSAGLGYYQVNDKYETFTYVNDSTVTGVDSIPIMDQNDSIIGYQYVYHYDDSTQFNHPFNYRISNIVIPIYLTKQFDFGSNWGMLINAGAVFRMSKVTGGPVSPYGNDPVITRNSIMLSGRVHATYKWNSWLFSLGLNAGYYIKPPVEYSNIKTGRSFLTPEIGVHFNF